MLRNKWLVLAGLIVLCLAVGSLGGLATADSVATWYRGIAKPSWTPPDWLFGPVWTILYVAMAVAAWLVWRSGDRVRPAMVLFFTQLALNLGWTFAFFGARSPFLGLVEIAVFWVVLAATVLAFFGRSLAAGLIMLPYLAWVSFAGILNLAIWWLN